MYNLFKAYVPTSKKQCILEFKGVEPEKLLTLDEAAKLPEYAGILADDTVLVDIDDYETSEKLLDIIEAEDIKCRVYQTTRGKHFLFRNSDRIKGNKTKTRLACGLISDIKIGSKNSYSVLKFNGHDRPVIYDILEGEDYDTVPKWLTPVKSKIDFLGMENGDGRNQALFNYILTLQSAGFTKAEARETIEIINRYILKDPLSQRELDSVLRDEAFTKPLFFENGRFLHEKFAKFLMSEYNIVKIHGVLHYFKDGVYIPGNIETLMLKHIESLKRNQRQEVLSYIINSIEQNSQSVNGDYILFANGIYNINTRELEPRNENLVFTNKINWDYNPEAYNQTVDTVLNNLACNDKQIRALLEELIGYCFLRKNELRKAFVLKGERHNGKSTFLDMLAFMLGEDNISSLDLSDLSHEFKAIELFGKLANLGDDIEDEFIPNQGTFKKIVTGDRITCNVKYSAPVQFNPYCKLIFSANSIPRIGRGRDSSAVLDRLIIIPFNGNFSKENPNFKPFIKYDLHTQSAAEYLIKLGIEGLHRVLTRLEFTIPEESERLLTEYEDTLNPINIFFKEIGDDMENESTKKCYRLYADFCTENSLKPLSQIEFGRAVCSRYGYHSDVERLNGVITRVYKL